MLEHACDRLIRIAAKSVDNSCACYDLSSCDVYTAEICASRTHRAVAIVNFTDRFGMGLFCDMGRLGRFSSAKLGALGVNLDLALLGACRGCAANFARAEIARLRDSAQKRHEIFCSCKKTVVIHFEL